MSFEVISSGGISMLGLAQKVASSQNWMLRHFIQGADMVHIEPSMDAQSWDQRGVRSKVMQSCCGFL